MARNRHKKKTVTIVPPPAPQPAGKPSPAAQKVIERILKGGSEYLTDNFIHVMMDSARLAQEPEFVDLALDEKKAAQVTERWIHKYKNRLAAAEKKNQDEFRKISDDMLIKIIDELATPAFRKDVEQRLDQLQDRLLTKTDPNTLEIVLMLRPILGMKQTPWGLCGLIVAIYNRAMKQEIAAHEDEMAIFDAISGALKEEGEEDVDLRGLIDSPQKLDRLGQTMLAKDPGLRERLERQAWDMAHMFEKELREGKVALDVFTEEELLIPFQRLEAEYGQPFSEIQQTEELSSHIHETILQAIRDIMTPERSLRFKKDIEAMVTVWTRERKKWAIILEFEAGLIEEEFEDNPFVISAFVGHISRAAKERKRKR